MERRLLKDYIFGMLDKYSDGYRSVFKDISLIKSNPERVDRYGRRIPEMFREGFVIRVLRRQFFLFSRGRYMSVLIRW